MIKVELIIVAHLSSLEQLNILENKRTCVQLERRIYNNSIIKEQLISNIFAFVCNNNI